eukprot:6865015-Prymnesium_polylepis.1
MVLVSMSTGAALEMFMIKVWIGDTNCEHVASPFVGRECVCARARARPVRQPYVPCHQSTKPSRRRRLSGGLKQRSSVH